MYLPNWIFRLLILCLIACSGCSSDSSDDATPDNVPARGRIIELTKLQSFSTDQIRTNLGLIDAQHIFLDDLQIKHNVSLYKVLYETPNPSGELVQASGLFLIPDNVNDAPLLSLQHGATMSKEAVPSRLSLEYFFGLAFASEGYVTTMPDYVGLGDGAGLHPFVHADTEASATIDILRSARNYCTENSISLNGDVFLAGYSQGGHATMATIKEIEANHASEFNVKAVVPSAGPLDVSGTQSGFMLRNEPYVSSGLVAYVVFAYNEVYKFYNDPSEVFASPYAENLTKHFTAEMNSSFEQIAQETPASNIPREMFQSAFLESLENNPNNGAKLAMQDNDVYDLKINAPLKICHCSADEVITVDNATVAVKAMKAKGTNVEWIDPFPQGNHGQCAIFHMKVAHDWFMQLR